MRKLCLLVALMGAFYVLSYDKYYFNPCSGNICLAISGYDVDAKDIICDSLKCVEGILNSQGGTDHLRYIHKIEYSQFDGVKPSVRIEEVKTKKKVTVE